MLRGVYRLIAPCLLALELGLMLGGCADDDDAPRADAAIGRDSGRPGSRDGGGRDGGGRPRDGGGQRDGAPEPDPIPKCPQGSCDLLDPDSCDEGEGCVFALDGQADDPFSLSCQPVGSGAEGDRCMKTAECGAGLGCSAYDGTGRCRQYCCALSRTLECPEGQFCRVGLDSEEMGFAVGLCDGCDGCDPLDADACGSGLSCYPLPGSIDCTACLPPGARKPGEACELSTDCARGSACFRFDGESSLCVEFCELDSDTPCSDAKRSCRAVAGAKLPVGVALCL